MKAPREASKARLEIIFHSGRLGAINFMFHSYEFLTSARKSEGMRLRVHVLIANFQLLCSKRKGLQTTVVFLVSCGFPAGQQTGRLGGAFAFKPQHSAIVVRQVE